MTIPVDAHVHLHRCFDPARFFDCARTNFRAAAGALCRSSVVGCLWLTDTPQERSFHRLAQAGLTGRTIDRWALSQTHEASALAARHESGDTLLLLAGRQISTRERLEVLALGTELDLPSGQSLADTIAGIRESGAIAVIPWGFGKWWFQRSRLLAATLASLSGGGVFLGDNGGRPGLIPLSPMFELAAARGIYNLPGSDPLPLPWEVRKPGRLGAILEVPLDLSRPVAALLRTLCGLRAQPPLFGGPESLAGFVRSQVGIRLPARLAVSTAEPADHD